MCVWGGGGGVGVVVGGRINLISIKDTKYR